MSSPRRREPRREAGESKRDATRRNLLDRALALFRAKGVEATTMRDVARAAGLSLGAAYYYFPSKDALVFAYYEANQIDHERLAATLTGTLRERLGALLHGRLRALRDDRPLLASILPRLIDPGDPVSAFSAASRSVRERAIAVFAHQLDDLPPEAAALVAEALWLMMLAALLLMMRDDTHDQRRTHGLLDEALDLVVPLLPLLATPAGQALVARVAHSLKRAGLQVF